MAFDPNKYDRTSSASNKVGDIIDRIENIISTLKSERSFIEKECESMEKYISEHPENENAKKAFVNKLDGWSRILNGLTILDRMYLGKKKAS